MNTKLERILTEVAEETFASMVFILPPEEETLVEDKDNSQTIADITFSGPFSGSLFLSVPQSMLPILAANILGLEDDGSIPPEEQQDALKEVLNVICGNLLPLIATPKDVFQVHQPRIASRDEIAEIFASDVPQSKVHLLLECGEVELSLCLNRPASIYAV